MVNTMIQQSRGALANLEQFLRQYDSAIIAYSGGVDSAVVMAVAVRVLGLRALACIGVSPSYPQRERMAALALAEEIGATVQIVETAELVNPDYATNSGDRCYHCKNELYKQLSRIARARHYAVILDGNNASDATDDRPGRRAAHEHGVVSPLASLGIAKPQVRLLAKELALSVWDKPATPCLSSRVPHGVPIMPEILKKIENAENVLAHLGFKEFRVRHHGDIARVEVPVDDMLRAVEMHEQIALGIERAGYKFAALDLIGFRSGSLHAATVAYSDRQAE